MDVQTQPLIAEKSGIRVDPYAQPSSPTGPVAGLPPSVAASTGSASPQAAMQAADLNQDGELDEQEVSALHEAAAAGDDEANQLLIALGLTGTMAATGAALYAANRGAKSVAAPHPGETQLPMRNVTSQSRAVVRSPIPVTQLNEEIIPRASGVLENPVKRIPAPNEVGGALTRAAAAVRRMH